MSKGISISLWVLSACLISCGSNRPKGEQPSWRSEFNPDVEPIIVTDEPEKSSYTFSPLSEPMKAYNSAWLKPHIKTPLQSGLLEEIRKASESLGVPPPENDPRLDVVATDLARLAADDINLDYSFIEFALHRQGVIEPSPDIVKIEGGGSLTARLLNQLKGELPSLLTKEAYDRVGIGHYSGNKEVTIMAFQQSGIKTNAIPFELPEEGQVPFRMELGADFTDPTLYMTRINGDVEKKAWSRKEDKEHSAYLDCKGEVGIQQVEVTAVNDRGPLVLANFPIWCGIDVPTTKTLVFTDEVVRDADIGEQTMLQLVNRDRQKAGLSSLQWEPRLAEVARLHSQDMLLTDVVAHVLPSSGSADDRVRKKGVKTSLLLENVARTYGVIEAQTGLMNSAGHRANILNPQASHVGLGIVLGKEVDGRREIFVTQLFARFPVKIDLGEAKKSLYKKIALRSPMRRSPELENISDGFAQRIVDGMSAENGANWASEEIGKSALSLTKINSFVTVVTDIDSVDLNDVIKDPKITDVGVGVAQGTHETLGENAIHVVLLLGFRPE